MFNTLAVEMVKCSSRSYSPSNTGHCFYLGLVNIRCIYSGICELFRNIGESNGAFKMNTL